ncbi:uncharacterized protein LOC131657458 [Vicia villosa]|uniref:uncharacterized protein LOC131657458 n=1 Tax=Vicia villosa TaxID=3911 RepID=UPI00273C0A3C|nr:uncharacterized protein LOC131657458 [Vicia villosa]
MKILSWNCRGLSNPRAIPNLRQLTQKHHPDVLFLSETLAKKQKLESVRVTLKFDSCLTVDVVGRSGGLAVLWKYTVTCNVVNYSRNFINLVVQDEVKEDWRLTCYYGFPERHRRSDAWNMLRELRDLSSAPWCVIGDFNDLLSQQDKIGLHPHPNWLCTGFREAVTDCNLLDLPLEGHQFTWSKSRGSEHAIEERLDRGLVTQDWLDMFPEAKLFKLLASHSDHSPILLQCEPPQPSRRKNYSFRFENAWLKEDDLNDIVSKGWNFDEQGGVLKRISNCAAELSKWNKLKFSQQYKDINLHMAAIEAA